MYISRDVVFDETEFPFSKLHSNAGARLREEISLLPINLLNPSESEQMGDHVVNFPNASDNSGESSAENRAPNASNEGFGGTRQDIAVPGVASGENPVATQGPAPGSAPHLPRSPTRPPAVCAVPPDVDASPRRDAAAREGETAPRPDQPGADASPSRTAAEHEGETGPDTANPAPARRLRGQLLLPALRPNMI